MLFAEGLQPQLSEAISGVCADSEQTILCGLNRAVTEVLYHLTVVDCLKSVDLTLFEDLLLAEPEFVTILGPPPRYWLIARLWIL